MATRDPWWRGLRARAALAAAAALALAACAADMPRDTRFPDRVVYKCEGGRTFQVELAPSGETALLTVEGRSYRLNKVPSAAQRKYSDGRNTLWLDGQNALVEMGFTAFARGCASETPLADEARRNRPLFGKDPWWR
ncbi:MAG: MliC family protein [Burkholderiales bacterium]|nr:MliC family protein [Burkholderiales bacterium]